MIWDVLAPTTVIVAVFGGAVTGAMLGWLLPKNPLYRSDWVRIGVGGATIIFCGVVFYLGQIIEAWASGDSEWPRLVGRTLLWCVFSIVLAVIAILVQERRQV